MTGRATIVVLIVSLTAGCAATTTSPRQPVAIAAPVVERWTIPLEAIEPEPRLPTTGPTRASAGNRPPVDALVAYAAACDAMARRDPAAAVVRLRQADRIDPGRFDVRLALGRALRAVAPADPDALSPLTTAVALDPTGLAAHVELARWYAAAHQPEPAVLQLRLATLTPRYAADVGDAATVDLLLSRALADAGYDRAAIERYVRLLERFHDPELSLVGQPELLALAEHPADLLTPIGQLYDRHGEWAAAVRVYEAAAAQDGGRFDVQRAIAVDQCHLGRAGDAAAADAAVRRATRAILRESASPRSLSLLADVCRELDRPGGATAVLRELAATRPDDRPVLLALIDQLVANGHRDEAADRLAAALRRVPGDAELGRKLAEVRGVPTGR